MQHDDILHSGSSSPSGEAADGSRRAAPGSARPAGRGVIDALVTLVEQRGLGVGDRLPPEVELARMLNVGRSTIREALKAWQSMGIVVRNKGAGTTLAAPVSANAIHVPLTLKVEAESLLRTQGVRRPLEIESARLAARNADEAQRRIILNLMAELMVVYRAGEDWRGADHRFHAAIHEASGNPLFGQLVQQIQKAFDDIYQAPFGEPQLGQRSIPIHKDLAEAIVEGDEARAGQVMSRIMDMVEEEVRAVIEGRS